MISFDKKKYYFDENTAFGVVKWIENNCTHPKGPLSGKPFILEDWQKNELFYPLFGLRDNITKRRKYKFVYIEIPKKNGKSPIMSCIIILMLKHIKDTGGRIVSLASSRDQAKIVFDDAKAMIKASPKLSKEFTIYQNAIMYGGKSYKPLSADVGTNDGGSNDVVIVDELHRFKKRELVDVMEGSQAAKEEPLFLMITTAGSDLNSICREKHEYAKKVKDGVIIDERFLPIIYAADKEDDPFIESTWRKANPNYGVSVQTEFFKEQSEKAKRSASYLNSFLRLHLNIWTNVDSVWITDDRFLKCGGRYNRDELFELLKNQPCVASLDLSSVSDLTSLTLMFPPNYEREFEPNKYISLNYYWLPEDKGKDSADKNNNNYLQWVKDGWIEETAGDVIDYDYLFDRITGILENFDLQILAYDPYNSIQIAAKFQDLYGENGVYKHRQGFVSFNAPMRALEIAIGRCEFLYDNNPVTRWCFSNTVCKMNAEGNLIKPDKNTYSQKIDGTVTNIMSMSMCLSNLNDDSGSYLDDEEVMSFEI